MAYSLEWKVREGGLYTSGVERDEDMQTNGVTKPTVLVVDDEREMADTYALALEGEYGVDVAYSGEAALDYLREFSVDVVLLDEQLPDHSGAEVLVSIRDWALDVRVVLVTDSRPSFDVLGLGFDGYLTRPVGVDGLRATVARLADARTYDSLWGELSQLRVCGNVLRAEHSDAAPQLESNGHYRALLARIRLLESREASYRASVDRAAESSPVRV